MNYTDAALFSRVIEAGSFTKAAEHLGLPKSSLSRRVARLERDLGVRLMQRTTRKLTLTEAGQTFFERVHRAVLGLEDAASVAREANGEPRGVVRASLPPGTDNLGIAPAVARFSKKYPAIQLELSFSARLVDLVSEGFDIAVRAGVLQDSSLIARRIGTADFGIFAAPSYLRRHGRPKTLSEVARHTCILFRARGGQARWRLSSVHGEAVVDVAGRISADDFAFMAELALSGAGIALLPLGFAREPVCQRELVPILPEYRSTGAPISVVQPSSEFVPSRVTLFRDALIEAISAELAATQRDCSARAHSPKTPRRSAR